MRTADERAALHARVDRERTAVRSRIAALVRAFDDIVESADSTNIDDEHDPEGATLAFERAQVIGLLEQARVQLEALDAVAARVDAGTFGICEHCGSDIPAERLAAIPTTQRCVRCAGAGSHRSGG